jgi:predicted glutamine amidotransferase
MILIEFITHTDKTIALAHNGVLSIKDSVGNVNFSKVSKDQAYDLACALMKWSNEQPVTTFGSPQEAERMMNTRGVLR